MHVGHNDYIYKMSQEHIKNIMTYPRLWIALCRM
jgi:hypothetical protein